MPWKLGCMPSLLKNESRSQKRLKLSIKARLCDEQADCSHVRRESSRLKRPIPRPSVGIGPEMKTDFSQLLKRQLKSCFRTLDCFVVVICANMDDNILNIWMLTEKAQDLLQNFFSFGTWEGMGHSRF